MRKRSRNFCGKFDPGDSGENRRHCRLAVALILAVVAMHSEDGLSAAPQNSAQGGPRRRRPGPKNPLV